MIEKSALIGMKCLTIFRFSTIVFTSEEFLNVLLQITRQERQNDNDSCQLAIFTHTNSLRSIVFFNNKKKLDITQIINKKYSDSVLFLLRH